MTAGEQRRFLPTGDIGSVSDRTKPAERRCPTCHTVLPAAEFWIIHSENHLDEGCLAYWGPWPTREAAAASGLSCDETYPIVEVPTEGGVPA